MGRTNTPFDTFVAQQRSYRRTSDPRGLHSDTLQRVLNYFRRSSGLSPYVVICTQPFREWRVARLTGVRGQAPVFVDEQRFSSEADAMHAVFPLARAGDDARLNAYRKSGSSGHTLQPVSFLKWPQALACVPGQQQ
jgi:hypothetical protein